jgi:hypothetical protein
VLQLYLPRFFKALPNVFKKNGFTREAPEGRIHFFTAEEKKKIGSPAPPTS